MFKTAIAGWLWRRLWDWGGHIGAWVSALAALYSLMPPSVQQTVGKIATGHWGEVTLAAAGPALVWAISQLFSLRATTKPQVVTEDGKKADLKALPQATQTVVNTQAETAVAKQAKKPNLLEKLGALFGR